MTLLTQDTMPPHTRAAARAESPSKPINTSDVLSSLTLLVMWFATSILNEGALRRFCGLLGRLHLALRGSKAGDLTAVPELGPAGTDLRLMEQRIMKRSYEELAQPFLERRKGGWHPEIRLAGREHLDRALEEGHGAVLWVVPSFSGELVFRKAIHATGLPLVDLRTPSHPYSGTDFGRKYLNPIRLEVENRYMTERVLIHNHGHTQALLELKEHLRQNQIVKFMASPNSENPPEFPLFGGLFKLAMGAPALAKLGKAPIMPVFVTETPAGSYVVEIGAPLEITGSGTGRATWDALGAAYVEQMKKHVLRNPDQWPGWYARDSWTPDTGTSNP